jgi:phosphoenolpyruvate---glycerone phosphotransferase subunit DhaL
VPVSETVSVDRIVEILVAVTRDLEAAKGRLDELDSAAGDGDMGISMARGCRAVRAGLEEHPQDAGRVLMKAGMDFGEGAGATIGALLSTGLMRAGKEVQGQTELSLPDVARMVKAAETGIRTRGKAEPGNRTLLDALVPARVALEEATQEGLPAREALARVLEAAELGMLATADMRPTIGRARWMADRATGHQDPGATAVYLIVKSIAEAVERRTE